MRYTGSMEKFVQIHVTYKYTADFSEEWGVSLETLTEEIQDYWLEMLTSVVTAKEPNDELTVSVLIEDEPLGDFFEEL